MLPALAALAIFAIILRAVIFNLARPLAKVALVVGALVLFHALSPATVRCWLVGVIEWTYGSAKEAYQVTVGEEGQGRQPVPPAVPFRGPR